MGRLFPLRDHLNPPFPHVSTQVVDFPRICNVRVFGEMRRNHRDTEHRASGDWSQPSGAGTKAGNLKVNRQRRRGAGNGRNVTHFYAKIREDSRKSTKVRTDQAR